MPAAYLKVCQLMEQIDASYQSLFSYSHGLNISDHIFIGDDEKTGRLAETLVESSAGNCYISIRISKELASTVPTNQCPFESLQTRNLSLFSILAEEVSHFQGICLAAQRDNPISAWDLELQSEFDKFILATTLMKTQSGRSHAAPLARLLFDSTYNYTADAVYDHTGNIAAHWWWTHINQFGDHVLARPDVWRNLLEMRSLRGQAKLEYIALTQRRVTQKLA